MAKLTLVVIARNEAHCIGRCLESAAQIVDEMVVLDTGSTDETVAIATSIGARVHFYAWNDDFSAARNAALAHANAEWNLILDADEWIEGEAGQLRSLCLLNEPFIGVVPVVSYFDLQGRVEAATTWIPRLLPKGVRYQGRIHEQPVADIRRQPLSLRIGHDGYRQLKLQQKKGRNKALLQQALQETPSDAYLHYQLGKDHEVYEEYAEAVPCFLEALRLCRMSDPFRHDLVIRTIFSLKQDRQHQQAIQLAEREFPNWQHSPDFFFCLGDLMLDWAALHPADALQEWLPMVESSWKKCLEIGEQPFLSDSVKGRGSYLAARNLALMYENLGDTAQARQYRAMAESMQAAA